MSGGGIEHVMQMQVAEGAAGLVTTANFVQELAWWLCVK